LPSAGGADRFDYRLFSLEQRWLNTGEGVENTLEAPRTSAQRGLAYDDAQTRIEHRPPVPNPERRLPRAAGEAPADLPGVRQFRESNNSVRLFHRAGYLPVSDVHGDVGL